MDFVKLLNPENTLTIQDIEKICINIIENNLYWYERETEDFFILVEKPLKFKQSLFLTLIKNDLFKFDEQIMKEENLTNDNLKYPFSKLHILVNFYNTHIDVFYKEIFNLYEDNTHIIDLLEDKFYIYAEQLLKENEKYNLLNEDIQIEILSQFTPLEHINKNDAMILLKLLI